MFLQIETTEALSPPPPPPLLPSTWLRVQFLQDGPWRLPEEGLQPGPLELDIVLIQKTLRKGLVFMGRDTPTHKFTLSLPHRVDTTWSSLAVRQELYCAVEDNLYDHVKLAGEEIEVCLDQLEDSLGRLVWSSSANSWFLPITFLVLQDWVLPTLVFWSTRNATAFLSLDEERARSWIREMASGICRGFSIPWQI